MRRIFPEKKRLLWDYRKIAFSQFQGVDSIAFRAWTASENAEVASSYLKCCIFCMAVVSYINHGERACFSEPRRCADFGCGKRWLSTSSQCVFWPELFVSAYFAGGRCAVDIGLGFAVGLLIGTAIAVVAAVIVIASRKMVSAAARQTRVWINPTKPPAGDTKMIAADTKVVTGDTKVFTDAGVGRGGTVILERDTGIVDSRGNEERETRIDAQVREVKELLLRLTDIVSSTSDASGHAAEAFASAKGAIDAADLTDSDDLAAAQRLLIDEINRVLESNASLHNELTKARLGIAEQRRQIEELRTLARIDNLTRTPNRAAFDERLAECLALLKRADHAFSLLILDIDHFKKVNDTYGHVNGDRILRGVAAKINDSVRAEDFVARYGGEEFAVIFPETRAKDAFLVAERIRQSVANAVFRLDGSGVKMTISGGLAEGKKTMDATGVISAADAALYRAKNGGRNRTEITLERTAGTTAVFKNAGDPPA